MMLWGAILFAFATVYGFAAGYRKWFEPARVLRMGYVEGHPWVVKCTCGSRCHRLGRYTYEHRIWWEWICPKCQPEWRSYVQAKRTAGDKPD